MEKANNALAPCGDVDRALVLLLALLLRQNGASPELIIALLYVAL